LERDDVVGVEKDIVEDRFAIVRIVGITDVGIIDWKDVTIVVEYDVKVLDDLNII